MSNIVVVFDIDGFYIDEPAFFDRHADHFFIKWFGKEKINPHALKPRDIYDIKKWQELLFRICYARKYVIEETGIPGFPELCRQILADGDPLYFLTQRDFSDQKGPIGSWMRNQVRLRILRDGSLPEELINSNIIFANKGTDKVDYCQALSEKYQGATIILGDDNPKIISANARAGHEVIKRNTPYNQNVFGTRIHAVDTPQEMYPIIQKIKNRSSIRKEQ